MLTSQRPTSLAAGKGKGKAPNAKGKAPKAKGAESGGGGDCLGRGGGPIERHRCTHRVHAPGEHGGREGRHRRRGHHRGLRGRCQKETTAGAEGRGGAGT